MRTVQDVLTRLRAEFLEMPGLRLTPEQVQRLCGVERMDVPGSAGEVGEREVSERQVGLSLRTSERWSRTAVSASREGRPQDRTLFEEGIVTLQLFSIGIAVTLVTVAVLMMVVLAKRPIAVDKLGSVSDRWIAQHRVD